MIASGWFAEVLHVRRAGDHVVEIEGRFLKPSARVLDEGRNLLIDREGFVLPDGYRVGDSSHLVQIIAPNYQPPEHAGILEALAQLHQERDERAGDRVPPSPNAFARNLCPSRRSACSRPTP